MKLQVSVALLTATALRSHSLAFHGWTGLAHPPLQQEVMPRNSLQRDESATNEHHSSRRRFFSVNAALISGLFFHEATARAVGDEDDNAIIRACEKPSSGAPPNCVSTASVKQVDLYAAPWTWYDDSLSTDAILARLKGAISYDPTLTIVQQSSNGLIVEGKRNFAVDRIVFRVNPEDRAVTFQSRQIEGPENVSDFSANRKRLEQVRKKTQILEIMGSEFASADSGRREGAADQLKAFWGFQSGGGYESVLLDEDE